MKAQSPIIVAAIAINFLLIIGTMDDAIARGGGFGGGSRGGGRGDFSRSGVAASGSFSSSRQATMSANQAGRRSAISSTSSANQAQRQSAMSANQVQRQAAQSNNVKTRQQGVTQRTYTRNITAQTTQGNYRPGYYPSPAARAEYYDNHNDDWDSGEVAAVAVGSAAIGAVAGYAAGQSSSQNTAVPPSSTVVYAAPPPTSGLPCNPNTAVVKGVTYYQCGSNWYTQAYGNSGVIYMPVPSPY